MSLSRPTRFFPDKTSGDYQAIDGKKQITSSEVDNIIANDKTKATFKLTAVGSNNQYYISTPFTFIVKGNSALKGYIITIYNMANNLVFKSDKVEIANGLFPIDYLGRETVVKSYLPIRRIVGGDYLDNTIVSNYKWTVEVFWEEYSTSTGLLVEKSLVSSEVYFESRPTLDIQNIIIDKDTVNEQTYTFSVYNAVIEGTYHTFDATITPSKDIYPIAYFTWRLKDSYGIVIYDTGIVESQDVRFEYDGFLPFSYSLELTVVSISNNSITKTMNIESFVGDVHNSNTLNVENVSNESCLRIFWGEIINGELKVPVVEELISLGIITSINDIAGYDLYRQKRGELFAKRIFARFTRNAYEAFDYEVVNGGEYTYFLYPILSDNTIAGNLRAGTYDENGFVYHKAWFNYWSLLVLSPNENKENTYRVFKEFRWFYNLENTNIKTNANVSINPNFNQFPRVQKGKTNYLTINLSGLIGYISCDTYEYLDSQEILEDLRALPTVDNEMVLKSPKGAIMRVVPTGDVQFTIQERIYNLLTTASIELIEVGSVNNISIVNKVANPKWMFTLNGFQPINTISMNMAGYTISDGTILSPSSVTIE